MLKLLEVLECYLMLGDGDALLRIVTADIDAYRRFQSIHLSRMRGLRNVKTDVPGRHVRQSQELPLQGDGTNKVAKRNQGDWGLSRRLRAP